MAIYRTVKTSIWHDSWLTQQKQTVRLAWFFLLTNPATTASGIYEMPDHVAASFTRLSLNQWVACREAIEAAGKAYFAGGWVFVRNYIRHQPSPAPKTWASILEQLQHCPSPLVGRWLDENHALVPIAYAQAIDRLSIGTPQAMDRDTIGSRASETETEVRTETETETESTKDFCRNSRFNSAPSVSDNPTLAAKRPACPTAAVEQFWNETFAASPIPNVRRPLCEARKRKLRLRWGEWASNGSDPWAVLKALCDYIGHDAFHLGENERHWTANLDYLIRNDTKWRELLERADAEKQGKLSGSDRKAMIEREVAEFFGTGKEAKDGS